ncbi:MAG: hypothetical protein ACREP0_07050 [Rhodanobacteraceae bacterium]
MSDFIHDALIAVGAGMLGATLLDSYRKRLDAQATGAEAILREVGRPPAPFPEAPTPHQLLGDVARPLAHEHAGDRVRPRAEIVAA